MSENADKQSNNINDSQESARPEIKDAWSIRPCHIYKEEFDDCKSIKARFHQYFIHGENTDCSQWQVDYKNCVKYEESNGNDVAAAEAIVASEKERRLQRLRAHYANDTWKKRASPPADWSGPLPEWLEERNKNSYLDLKQMELDGRRQPDKDSEKSYCVIM